MKKRVLSIIALMCCILETFCMPVGATNLDQDEAEIIATEEFVVYGPYTQTATATIP